MMDGTVEQVVEELRESFEKALLEERQKRITRAMLLFNESGYCYAWIVKAVWEIFGERFTEQAARMRVRNMKLKNANDGTSD